MITHCRIGYVLGMRAEGKKLSRRTQLTIRLILLSLLVGLVIYEFVAGESIGGIISGVVAAAFSGWVVNEAHMELKLERENRQQANGDQVEVCPDGRTQASRIQ
jgi:hypothetical protein